LGGTFDKKREGGVRLDKEKGGRINAEDGEEEKKSEENWGGSQRWERGGGVINDPI